MGAGVVLPVRVTARYGLTYKVRSSAELNPIFGRNLSFLEDFLRDPDLQVDKAALKLMRELFAEEPVMTLKALLEYVEAQHIYVALLRKQVYVDLYRPRWPIAITCMSFAMNRLQRATSSCRSLRMAAGFHL